MKTLKPLSLALMVAVLLLPVFFTAGTASAGQDFKNKKIVAEVFVKGDASDYQKTVQSRLESILEDNGVIVLDKKKSEELKDVLPSLEDPNAFITPETFVANAEKFDIDGVIAVYVSVDKVHGVAGYYSATSQAEIRFVDSREAKPISKSEKPMGTPGFPPSDGLTADSAIINAVQRAVDKSCETFGFRILDPVRPKFITVRLEERAGGGQGVEAPRPSASGAISYAKLESKTWSEESVTATAASPDGAMAAVAGYIVDTDFQRRPPRMYGSRIHLIDMSSKNTVNVFECYPVGKIGHSEKGGRKILDTVFLGNWRFLAAVSGSQLFLWETESGRQLSTVDLGGIDSGTLRFIMNDQKSYLVLDSNNGRRYFEVVMD